MLYVPWIIAETSAPDLCNAGESKSVMQLVAVPHDLQVPRGRSGNHSPFCTSSVYAMEDVMDGADCGCCVANGEAEREKHEPLGNL